MPNNCLSVLYKHIIQVENKNMGLKVRGEGGHKHIIAFPPTLRFLRQCYSTFNFSANKNRKQNRNSTLFVQTETETETEAKFHNRTSLSSVVRAFGHGTMGSQIDPLSYFSFQPVLHDWCNKGRGMCYPVCGNPCC